MISKRTRHWISFKKLRRERFLKLLSFLYLKQECVLSKHIKQLCVDKQKVLAKICLQALKRHRDVQFGIKALERQRELSL